MKKLNILFIALIFSVFCSAQSYGPNLIVNGDFEPSNWINAGGPAPTGWISDDTSDFKKETTDVISGTQSLRLGRPVGGVSMYQDITVEANANYQIGFTCRSLDAAGPSGGTLTGTNDVTMEVRNVVDGVPQSPALTFFSISNNINTPGTANFTSTSNTTVRISVYKMSKIVYIDNVFVQKNLSTQAANSVPEEKILFSKADNRKIQVCGDNISSISIMNLVGNQIYRQSTNSANTFINMEHLPTGVYIVEVTLNSGRKVVSKQII